MRTTTKFKLDEPTREKWDKYITLIPEIDKIARNIDVGLITRLTDETDYSVEEVFDYRQSEQFTRLINKLSALVERNNLSFTLIKNIDEPNPEGFKTSLKLSLRAGYRSNQNWENWIDKMPEINEGCMFHGVHLARELDMENYSVRTTAYYKHPSEIASAFFVSGWIYGFSNIPLEISEIFEERYSLDLIQDMKDITNKVKTSLR